jgi:hypothetical protein
MMAPEKWMLWLTLVLRTAWHGMTQHHEQQHWVWWVSLASSAALSFRGSSTRHMLLLAGAVCFQLQGIKQTL